MKHKNLTIEVVKGIAIILVVYGHVIQRSMLASGQDFFLNPAFQFIYIFHMPLFFFISGYLLAFSLGHKNLRDVFKSKCRGLLVPFVCWVTLDVIVNSALSAMDGKWVGIGQLPLDLVDQLIVSPVLWFLLTLFLASGILLAAIKLERRLGPVALLLSWAFLLVIPFNQYGCLYYLQWFYPFLGTGYLVNKYQLKIQGQAVQWIGFLLAVVVLVMLAAGWGKGDYIYLNKMAHWADDPVRLAYRYVAAFAGIVAVFFIGKTMVKAGAGFVLALIGGCAFDIYLLQRYLVEGFFLRFMMAMHWKFEFDSFFFLGIFTPVVVMIAIGLCMAVSMLLIRKNVWLSRLLLGGR